MCKITILHDSFRKLSTFMRSSHRYALLTEQTEQSESSETIQQLNEGGFQFDFPVKIQRSLGSEHFAGTKSKSQRISHQDVNVENERIFKANGTSRKSQDSHRHFSLADYVNKSFKWNFNRKESKEKLQRTENKQLQTERIVRFDVPQATKCKRRTDIHQRQSANEKLLFSDIPTTAEQEIFDFSKRQLINTRSFCHDDDEAERLRKAAFARLHAEQERARREAFVSILITKLNQVKRDQEVRECLGDCLRDFRPYSPHRGQVRTCRFRFAGNQLKKVFRKRKKNGRVHKLQESRKCTSPEPQLFEKSDQVQYSNPAYTTVGYCFGRGSIPFITRIEGTRITLKQFKNVFRRRGNYRYFFKKHSNEFGTEAVFEEITEDSEILPLWEGKIFAKVEEI